MTRTMNGKRTFRAVMVMGAFLAAMMMNADGQQPEKKESLSAKTYLLVRPTDPDDFKQHPRDVHWTVVPKILAEKSRKLIKVAPRTEVDKSLFLETWGLRVFVETPECLETYKSLPAYSDARLSLEYLLRTLLCTRHTETAIEPDCIPVRGSAGKKMETKGMVLIEAGE